MMAKRIAIGPKHVLRMSKPTKGFLCSLSSNVYNIEFVKFAIRDDASKRVFFEMGHGVSMVGSSDVDCDNFDDDDCSRAIKYTLSEDVLRLPVVSTSLTFTVGENPVANLRMIERHYFQNQLVKSYDFSFGFCIPLSTNSWDAIYDVPPLNEDIIQKMIENPFETVSDSFYFVGDELIMHNKARYQYVKEKKNWVEHTSAQEFASLAMID
ncbi:hypothetical protein ACHAW5_001560 [Stephanodiscus triporus]|uniref:GMP phosphodiesterase delta subunit domain-containing protein n=1 Tax=Stephanodiscus triporus TaxID=2934178 RepID=A0ABD3NKI3_9STRA